MSVRIWLEPLTLIPKVSFRCTKCWKYSPRIKCKDCYPSKCFPLPCEKYPPKDKGKWYEKQIEWDSWYIYRYLLEPTEDPEEIYQIYASEITERIKRTRMIEKMSRKDKFKYGGHIRLGMSSECKAFKYRFAKKAKHI